MRRLISPAVAVTALAAGIAVNSLPDRTFPARLGEILASLLLMAGCAISVVVMISQAISWQEKRRNR